MSDNYSEFKSELISELVYGNGKKAKFYSLPKLKKYGYDVSRLPFSIRIILESLIRNLDGKEVSKEDIFSLSSWNPKSPDDKDVPFKVSRVLMQDFTGVPAIVDLTAIRDYVASHGKDAEIIQPHIPTDLIIDHSEQVDSFNDASSFEVNQEKEIERNKERYSLLKWASQSFNKLRVFPPSAGICHQINLEYLATCVSISDGVAFPDTLVGTDSHTTMICSLGVVGFGVGGIEAEAALLGQAVSLTTPKVLGVKLTGKLDAGVTATDFALTLTKILRERGVVNMFVEFFGDGLKNLSLPDRATLSNMCPEYGATIAIFPVDEETLRYMEITGRSSEQTDLIRKYYSAQEMLGIDYGKIEYSDMITVRLDAIVPCVSGPSQPKQEISLDRIRDNFIETFTDIDGEEAKSDERISSTDYTRWSTESVAAENGAIKRAPYHEQLKSVHLKYDDGYETDLSDGDVVISSITSCTNTSNPSVMIAAGLLAKKAFEKGLMVDTRKVKTSLGPGSRVVMRYLEKAGLIEPLAAMGYRLVGYGCITCIGNSGPLIDKQSEAINTNNITVASVLSGNRNYEARIHRDVRSNYLMSPPLVIAFGIAGTMLKDLTKEPIGTGKDEKDVYLRDIWPSKAEIDEVIRATVSKDLFDKEYGSGISEVNPYWNKLKIPTGLLYEWDRNSTYIRLPPFFNGLELVKEGKATPILNARILAVFGDSISTDHISPAGAIGKDSPAGRYLIEHGVEPKDFNTYGTRRGNHEVMMRGTFANNRIKNLMLNGKEGGFTMHYPDMKEMSIYDAAMQYRNENVPLIVIAGSEYGSWSSRDWAAKGPMLLGVKAVIARGFERIHRSNLIGMGIMPLQFKDGEDANSLGIDYTKPLDIRLQSGMAPKEEVMMDFTDLNGSKKSAALVCRIDTEIEMEYFKCGGILNYVIKKLMGREL